MNLEFLLMFKFKVGDRVKVTSGKDKGREGNIEKIFPRESRAIVFGLNLFKRHFKGTGQKGQKSGIYELPRPIPFSKVALICPKCKKITRVGFKYLDGQKKRICKKCKKDIDSK